MMQQSVSSVRQVTRCLVMLTGVWSCSVALTTSLPAQELRIFTLTKDVSPPETNPQRAPVLSRSLTLFHAGKVYDYISELREVTIFEPSHRRFTVLNESAAAYAVISQDEVRRFLSLAEERARELASDLVRSNVPQQVQAVDLLHFQLHPEFATEYDAATRRLKLDSTLMTYDVVGAEPPRGSVLDFYLRYADAMAEFNAVLHPQSLLPGPRLELNNELRKQNLLPVSVRRKVQLDQKLELLAEHEWKWALTEHDRQFINRWETQITKGQVRKLSFEQLQRAVLTGKLSQR